MSSLVQELTNDIDTESHCILNTNFFCTAAMSYQLTVVAFYSSWYILNLGSGTSRLCSEWLYSKMAWFPTHIWNTGLFLELNKFGLNICSPSVKFTQCQTFLRNSFKVSQNDFLKDFWNCQAVTLIFNMVCTNPLRKFLKISALIKRINCNTT